MKTAVSLLGSALLTGAFLACGASLPGTVPVDEAAVRGDAQISNGSRKSAATPSLAATEEPLKEPVAVSGKLAGDPAPAPPFEEPLLAPVAVPGRATEGAAAPAGMTAGAMDTAEGLGGIGLSGSGRGAALGSSRAGSSGLKHARRSTHVRTLVRQTDGGVRAGEWDDNANFREFVRYLQKKRAGLAFDFLSLQARRFIVVRDSDGRAVPNCRVEVQDAERRKLELVTPASGRALLFPRAEGLQGDQLTVHARCLGRSARGSTNLAPADAVVDLQLSAKRALPAARTADVVFVLDTTGSMSEEISALTATIAEVAEALAKQNTRPRLGLVEYKDLGDGYVTRLHQMTTDVDGFVARVASLTAEGGGDAPEHVNAGLRVAVDGIRWSAQSVARLAFLIGDAPPLLHYSQDVSYTKTMQAANRQGIQIFTVAASGMDELGQVVWRQIAQYTGATNMFVLRGGAGPQSTGAGDAESSCGGTHQNYASGNLAELVTGKVSSTLQALEEDPLRIAGLGKDEEAKPCAERITLAR